MPAGYLNLVMMTGRRRYLLLLKSECYLKSKELNDAGSWNGDLLKLCLEGHLKDTFL